MQLKPMEINLEVLSPGLAEGHQPVLLYGIAGTGGGGLELGNSTSLHTADAVSTY